MKKRMKWLLALMFISSFSVNLAQADLKKGFDEKQFSEAQKQGKSSVLVFHANWCGTCRKQTPVVDKILGEENFKQALGFEIDFDSSADLKNRMKVRQQSTIIVFKGENEVARATGVTDETKLRELLQKGL